MSQTKVPSVGADEANDQSGGDGGVGRQPETSGFWGSMPRVLTALGGLVTAVGTAAAVYFGGIAGDDSTASSPPTSPGPQVVIVEGRATPAPAVETAVISRSSRTSGVLSGRETVSSSTDADSVIAAWESTLDSYTAAIAEGCANGAPGDCAELLEILLSECEDGYALPCDTLYLISPVGSALEEYGNSCGGRIPGNDAWCSDLVRGNAAGS